MSISAVVVWVITKQKAKYQIGKLQSGTFPTKLHLISFLCVNRPQDVSIIFGNKIAILSVMGFSANSWDIRIHALSNDRQRWEREMLSIETSPEI